MWQHVRYIGRLIRPGEAGRRRAAPRRAHVFFGRGCAVRVAGHLRRTGRGIFATLLLCCLFILPGCPEPVIVPMPPVEEKKPVEPVVTQPKKEEPAKPRYASLEGFRIRVLGQNEARQLARRMTPEQQNLKSWNDLRFSLEQSLDFAKAKPPDEAAVTYPTQPPTKVFWRELRAGLERMLEILPYLDDNPALLASEFRWLSLAPQFLFTGYFEPTMYASYRPSPMYSFPLYAKPPELQTGKLFYDRHTIDRKGILAGRGLELAWVRDEVDAFFLQIQGSGRLIFPDGKTKHVLYAGKNGHPYVPIGAVLRDKGLLDESNISMPSIRTCLLDNHGQKGELLDNNPSYVFFRLDDQGPVGSMGRILTPRVSLAVDPRVLPHGSMVFFNTQLPNQLGVHNRPIHALCLPQDSGGAIKGRRIDFFMGAGKAAEHTAGYLNQEGRVYLLLPAKSQYTQIGQ